MLYSPPYSELHKKGSVYVMDEPTTGLHMSDISLLLAIMNRLVDTGNTVVTSPPRRAAATA